jgi:NAD(P)-dependent dehydrogenase (short-subunit alcohol dehydrogenase family)
MKRIWMITGASRGLGARIAEAVLDHGDSVVVTARRRESIALRGNPEDVLALSMDVTDAVQVQAAMTAAKEKFGRIDVLVNNAGYGLLGAIEESSPEEIEAIYRTNVFGLLHVTRAVLPMMREQGSGHILNISSLGGYQASAGWGIYGSTKFAVEGITEALYAELKPLGIHATVIEPGFFRTDFMDGSSLRRTKVELEAYAATVGKTRSFADQNNRRQPGDPAKLAAVLIEIVNAPDPPVRLQAGSDAVRRIEAKNAAVAADIATWRTLSESTDL